MTSLIKKYRQSDVMFRASIWFICVTILNNGVSVITQPFLNRILSVEQIGTYGVYATWLSVFRVVATLYLFGGVLETQLTNNKEDSKQVIGSFTVLSILCSLCLFGLLLIFSEPVSTFLELKPIYIFIMGLCVIAEAIIQFWSVPKRFAYSYRQYSVVTILVFLSKAILSIIFSYLFEGDRVLGRLVGICIPDVVISVMLLIGILKNTVLSRITQYWAYGVRFNLPLIPHYLSNIVLSSSDRVMIQKMTNDTDVGLYSVAYSVANLCLIVFTAMNNAYSPYAMNAIREKNYDGLNKKTNYVVSISVLFASLMMLFSPEGLWILGGEKYLPALPIMPVLVVGIFISSFYFIFSNVEFVYEKNKYIFPITLVGGLLNIVLNYLLIPVFGYTAAAYTTVIGYVVIAVLHYFVSFVTVGGNIYNMPKILLNVLFLVFNSIFSAILYDHTIIRYAYAVIIVGVSAIILIFNMKKNKETDHVTF